MYGISLREQIKILLMSLGMGFLLGVVYDIFRIIRLSVKNEFPPNGRHTKRYRKSVEKWAVFVQDILFFAVFASLTFSFVLISNSGNVRFFILAAEVSGFIIYYFSFGEFVISVSDKLIRLVRKIFYMIFRIIIAPFSLIYHIFKLIFIKISKSIKKLSKKYKLLLHIYGNMLYNVTGIFSAKNNGRNIRKKNEKAKILKRSENKHGKTKTRPF